MEREVPIDGNSWLQTLLEETPPGEAISITRDGEVVATLQPEPLPQPTERAKSAADWIKTFPKIDLGDSVVDLIRAGRKH
jgi:hypothetical protein